MKRVNWIFLCTVLCALGVQAGIQNEWTFEGDGNGVALPAAFNSGTDGSSVQFAGTTTNFQSTLFTTNRTLLSIGDDTTGEGVWTNGAVLNAPVSSISSGVRYLRYDLNYSLTNDLNDSGTILGVYFTDSANDRVAGLVLGYDKGNLETARPASVPVTAITNGLANSGTLTAIAAMDLDSGELKVWYSLDGSTTFSSNSPSFSKTITLDAIDNLRFHATGDIRPDGSTDYAAIDNIRMADSWADITASLVDFSQGPQIEISRLVITNPNGTFTSLSGPVGTDIGQTNTVEVVVRSLGAPAATAASVTNTTNPDYFAISSTNAPAVIEYSQYVTNTFSVIVGTNAQDTTYPFSVNATADSAAAATNFYLTVGSLVSYIGNSISVISTNGILADRYEPGEVLNITVTNANNGATDVSGVVNSLFADPAYVTISNLTSATYASLAVGAVTTTTYQVTINDDVPDGTGIQFSVTNQTASKIWPPGSFSINVFSRGVLSVSPASITLNVLEGALATNAQVVVTNSGNRAATFSISDNGAWDSFYTATTGTSGKSAFVTKYENLIVLTDPSPNSSSIEAANAGVSSAKSIGFSFPFYGTTYSNFYVTADGYIGLINTTNTPLQSLDHNEFPCEGGIPLVAPFWGNLVSPAGSIRYTANSVCLAVNYTGVLKEHDDTVLDFQAALFPDGTIEFRYKTITAVTNTSGLSDVTIGLQGGLTDYTNLTVRPVNGTSIRLEPQQNRWVSYTPAQAVTVNPQSSQIITFVADASDEAAGDGMAFNAWFTWSSGGSNSVSVTANVVAAVPAYSAAGSLSFTGAAGRVTSAPFVITNTGTGPLTFSINNSAAASAGFISTNANYEWIDISQSGTEISLIDPSPDSRYITAADEGFSKMIPIGFVFPFYGGSYTQFCASVNGALRLDTTGRVYAAGNLASISSLTPSQMIAPYWGELLMDTNATLKYLSTEQQLVVTWENVRQYGIGGGSNLTFQAILDSSGNITFQYKKLEGALQWPNTPMGLRDTASRTAQADIRLAGDWSVSTSSVSGSVYTQYVESVDSRAWKLLPSQVQVIRCSPSSNSIPAGGTAEVSVIGDASNQSTGSDTAVTSATLTITHNAAGSPATLAVTFTATNSQETVFVRAAALADSDGDGVIDDAERIAGTDPQDAGSVFTPDVTLTPEGALLSWAAPLDGIQRTYTIYFTTDLMGIWDYLDTVTSGTAYVDTQHSGVSAIYYKITVE